MKKSMYAQIAADLRAAADIIDRDGWTQGLYHDDHGCHCADGALALATGAHEVVGVDDEGFPLIHEHDVQGAQRWRNAFDYMNAYFMRKDSLIGWNDVPGRTATEVVGTLHVAADAADARA